MISFCNCIPVVNLDAEIPLIKTLSIKNFCSVSLFEKREFSFEPDGLGAVTKVSKCLCCTLSRIESYPVCCFLKQDSSIAAHSFPCDCTLKLSKHLLC